MKRIKALVLLIIFILSFSTMYIMAEDSYIPFYDGDIEFVAQERGSLTSYSWFRLSDVSEFAVLFNSAVPFKGIRLYGDGPKPHPTVNVSLYNWNDSFDDTLKSEPVLSEDANVFGDWWYNDYLFEAGTQVAGQYVITFVHDGNLEDTHGLNMHRHPEISENIEMYIDGMLVTNGTYELGLLIDGEFSRDDVFISLIEEVISTVIPSEETQPPETQPDNTLAPTSNPTEKPSSKAKDNRILPIAIGSVGLILVIAIVIFVIIRKNKKNEK